VRRTRRSVVAALRGASRSRIADPVCSLVNEPVAIGG
jgi:hypothetical protein